MLQAEEAFLAVFGFAITLYTFAIMTKLTYEDADAACTAAYRALRSMGCASFPAFIHAEKEQDMPEA